MTLALAKEIADLATAALTAYLALRTSYIWYVYLRVLTTPRTPGSFLANLRQVLENNPPSSFPSADLPIATILLALSSIATLILGICIRFSAPVLPAG